MVRPTKVPHNGHSMQVVTTSVMVGIHESRQKELSNHSTLHGQVNSTYSPSSDMNFPIGCQQILKYASAIKPFIKRLQHVVNEPKDFVNILELKRDLVDLDNHAFVTLMIQLLKSFPQEILSHVSK